MQLPLELRHRMEQECDGISFHDLKQASGNLSACYRAEAKPQAGGKLRPLAYAVTRMPATIAAVHAVLSELVVRLPNLATPSTILDLGAGTGATWWALPQSWRTASVRMIESDQSMLALGRRLTPEAQWEHGDLRTKRDPADIVLLSYSLKESGADVPLMIEAGLKMSAGALVLIEPGTTAGFAVIGAAREHLLSLGARIAAPCPAESTCPMAADANKKDWCHFAARVERTSMHRRLKDGALGHEDEKFSYLIAAKNEPLRCASRVLRHPRQEPGLISFPVCAADGRLRDVRVTRRDALFKAARKLEWGGEWPPG